MLENQVFAAILERFSLQMPKMLENKSIFGPVNSKCSEIASARHKMRFLRAAMKKFIKAEHATEFIQRFFESKVFYENLLC